MITIHKIDAQDKSLGRVASSVAKILLGKTTADFTKNKVAEVQVIIENASKTKMTEKRMLETFHERYSGFPGGLKTASNAEIIAKKGFNEGAWTELSKTNRDTINQIL